MMHEVSGGRFRLGIGIAHGPSHVRMGVTPGKPLGDIARLRREVPRAGRAGPAAADHRRGAAQEDGGAGGRNRRGRGLRQCLAARTWHTSLAALPAAKRNDPEFFIGNMIPTCISDDVEAAKAVNRRTLTSYGFLPNYRNYWKEAGYVEEMEAIETAIAEGRQRRRAEILLRQMAGRQHAVRPGSEGARGVAAWRAAGVRDLILVPSSAAGNQMKAIEEVFAAFA